MTWDAIKNQPVFIGGHRKCGTTVFTSLLDAHKELFVYPSETGFFYKFYPVFLDNKYLEEEKEHRVIESILRSLDEVVTKWIGKEQLPEYSFDQLVFKFQERLNSTVKEPKDYYESVIYAAYCLFSKIKNSNKFWVDKTTSIEIYADVLFDWYPDAKFIHILRDPRDNYGSIKSGWDKRYKYQFDSKERLLQSLIDRALLGMRLAEINHDRYSSRRYLPLRFEDFTSEPGKELKRVCEFLEIDFSKSMLEPTFCGSSWGGNNFENKSFSTLSDENVNKWKSRISEHEAKVIEFYFRDLMTKYNYQLEYSIHEAADAARKHYEWFNYSQPYSIKNNVFYSINNS